MKVEVEVGYTILGRASPLGFSLIWNHHTNFFHSTYFNVGFTQAIIRKPEKKTKLQNTKNLHVNMYFRFFDFSQ